MGILLKDTMPITPKGFNSLAQTDYGCCDRSLAELIDNSWEVGYGTTFTNIISNYGPKKTGLTDITIVDNGPGMSFETLCKCLTVGSETEKTAETLGTYGMGLKSSCLWCGNEVTILTKTHDGNLLKAVFNIRGEREISDVDDTKIHERFKKAVKGQHGTVIMITNVKTYHFPKTKNGFNDVIKRGHGIIFSEFIKKNACNMMVNGERIIPIEYINKEISTKLSEDDAVWRYRGVDGVEKAIPYEAWFTPGGKNDLMTDQFLPRNQKMQGFICVRNGHMTGCGLTFDIVTKNNIFNGCKIILYLDGSTDNDFGVSFGKTQRGSIADDDIKKCFQNEFKRYFDASAKMQYQNIKNGEITEAIEKAVNQVEREIAENEDFQKALKEMKCLYEGEKTQGVNKKTENPDPKAVEKKTPDETVEKKHRKPRDGKTIKVCKKTFEICHEGIGENNQYFQPDFTPDGVGILRVNTDHNYYVNYINTKAPEMIVDVYRAFACEWLSVYGVDADKSEESIEQYNKRLLAKSRALSIVYKNKLDDEYGE